MAIKYTNIFHCKTLKNLPKKDFWCENMQCLATPPSMHLRSDKWRRHFVAADRCQQGDQTSLRKKSPKMQPNPFFVKINADT
jgi:hypothetical protein